MEIKFSIKGLDCANCARELEEKIVKNNLVKSCKINFMTQKMIIEIDNDENIVKIVDFCEDFEDGVKIKRI